MRLLVISLAAALLSACGGSAQQIPGTRVEDTQDNREIIKTIENYRLAVERQDAAALALMAHKDYWEDSGTPTGSDDYGYDGLREVLTTRFQQAEQIRYSIKYMDIKRHDDKAWVDVMVHASFETKDSRGELIRRDIRDQNQIVLAWDGETWKFLSGM